MSEAIARVSEAIARMSEGAFAGVRESDVRERVCVCMSPCENEWVFFSQN